MKKAVFSALVLVQLAGCSAEVGSKEWCDDLKSKSTDEWTVAESKDYTSHCLFK